MRITSLLLFALTINLITPVIAVAQSGRSKTTTPPPPPKPTTQQPPPITKTILNLPEGGKVVKYETDGVTARFVLKNGLTVIIRERHATVPVRRTVADGIIVTGCRIRTSNAIRSVQGRSYHTQTYSKRKRVHYFFASPDTSAAHERSISDN